MGVSGEEGERPEIVPEVVRVEVQRQGWHTRLATFLALPWVRYTLYGVLALLYTGWIGYQWLRNELFDFNAYYISAYGFVHGVDVYGLLHEYDTTNWPRWVELAKAAGVEKFVVPYLYPPLTAQLIVPLLAFPAQVGGMIWLALTAMAYLLSAWWLGKLWKEPEGASIVYLLFLGSVPSLATLHAGQVTGFVLLALTGAMVAMVRRNAFWSGFALAVASLLKLLPIALVFYLAWRKEWVAFVVAITSIVGLLLTSLWMFGTGTLSQYAANFLTTTQPGLLHSAAPNQALSGVLVRLLSPLLDSSTIYTLYLISALLLVIATIALCWPMASLPAYWRLEYSLIICTLMLIPPYNWYHMLVLLAIPMAVVVEQLWHKQKWGLLALLIALYVVTDIHGLFYHRFEGMRWLTSFPSLLVIYLWGLLAWAIVRERRLAFERHADSGLLATVPSQSS